MQSCMYAYRSNNKTTKATNAEVENTAVEQTTALPKMSAANPSRSVKQAGKPQTIHANEPERRT